MINQVFRGLIRRSKASLTSFSDSPAKLIYDKEVKDNKLLVTRAAAISSHEAFGVRFIQTPNNSALHRADPWLEVCFSMCARSFCGTPMHVHA